MNFRSKSDTEANSKALLILICEHCFTLLLLSLALVLGLLEWVLVEVRRGRDMQVLVNFPPDFDLRLVIQPVSKRVCSDFVEPFFRLFV